MPSDAERANIVSRISRLESELAPASVEEMIEVVRDLFAASPQQNVAPDLMRKRYAVFCEALSGLPLWALRTAAGKWVRGEAPGNPAFAPSAGELSRLATAETLPHRVTIEKLTRVLTAKPMASSDLTPETRARVATKFGDLVKSLTPEERRI